MPLRGDHHGPGRHLIRTSSGQARGFTQPARSPGRRAFGVSSYSGLSAASRPIPCMPLFGTSVIVGQSGEKAATAPIPPSQNRIKHPRLPGSGVIVGQKRRHTTRMTRNNKNGSEMDGAKRDKISQKDGAAGPLTRMAHDHVPTGRPAAEPGSPGWERFGRWNFPRSFARATAGGAGEPPEPKTRKRQRPPAPDTAGRRELAAEAGAWDCPAAAERAQGEFSGVGEFAVMAQLGHDRRPAVG